MIFDIFIAQINLETQVREGQRSPIISYNRNIYELYDSDI